MGNFPQVLVASGGFYNKSLATSSRYEGSDNALDFFVLNYFKCNVKDPAFLRGLRLRK